MPGFASDLTSGWPMLAASIKLFNDEFNEGLIAPTNASIFDRDAMWRNDEVTRFTTISALFKHGDAEAVQRYCKAVIEDPVIFPKLASFKRSTFQATAHGGCDSALCDQLLFLHEWLAKEHPTWLTLESGAWHYNSDKSYTEIIPGGSGFPAVRPLLRNPQDEEALIQMRHALQDYIIKHLKSLNCHVRKISGNLRYPVQPEMRQVVEGIVQQMSSGASVESLIGGYGPSPLIMNHVDDTVTNQGTMLMIYSDLEPDDIMAIAQIWQWKAETKKIQGEPLLVAHANFESKDGGTIFEQKQLMVATMLGIRQHYWLTHEGDDGTTVFEQDSSVHRQTQALALARDQTVHAICDRLCQFQGDCIELFLIAPGSGNIGAIVSKLKAFQRWPLRANWRVTTYSGSYNMRGMTEEDISALEEIMACSVSPLIDMSKFPFFGGRSNHWWTESLTTFAMPGFAEVLSQKYPFIGALLKKFNDDFNQTLIKPDEKKLFKGSELTDDERARFDLIKVSYRHSDGVAIQQYAKAVLDDADLWAKVVRFKRNTVIAMAYGACDSPICDQLAFLYEWLLKERPDSLVMVEGNWYFDREKGFTSIKQDGTGSFRAIQPMLLDPLDEALLVKMRNALEEYFLRHLQLSRLTGNTFSGGCM